MQRPSPRLRPVQFFIYETIRRNVIPKFIDVWRRHAGAHPDGQQHGDRKPIKTYVTEFLQLKREFLSRGTHKH